MNTQSETRPSNQVSHNQTIPRRNRPDAPNLGDAAQDALAVFQDYAKERPDVVAFTCLGVGFILGWKLKPW